MDKAVYQQWQSLHDRWARGETLTAEEAKAYEAGCAELDAEEILPGRLTEIRTLRAKADQLEAQLTHAQEEYHLLRAEIAVLESRLSEPTRQLLGIASH